MKIIGSANKISTPLILPATCNDNDRVSSGLIIQIRYGDIHYLNDLVMRPAQPRTHHLHIFIKVLTRFVRSPLNEKWYLVASLASLLWPNYCNSDVIFKDPHYKWREYGNYIELLTGQKGKSYFHLDCVNNSMNDTELVQRKEGEGGERLWTLKIGLVVETLLLFQVFHPILQSCLAGCSLGKIAGTCYHSVQTNVKASLPCSIFFLKI